jgi:hypothetical protein
MFSGAAAVLPVSLGVFVLLTTYEAQLDLA